VDNRLAYNTTDSPVIVTKDGRTLGGGEFGPVDADDKAVQAAIDAGWLTWRDDVDAVDADKRNEQATAALEELAEVERENAPDTASPTTSKPRRGSTATS
jgi:hypothetical protein